MPLRVPIRRVRTKRAMIDDHNMTFFGAQHRTDSNLNAQLAISVNGSRYARAGSPWRLCSIFAQIIYGPRLGCVPHSHVRRLWIMSERRVLFAFD